MRPRMHLVCRVIGHRPQLQIRKTNGEWARYFSGPPEWANARDDLRLQCTRCGRTLT